MPVLTVTITTIECDGVGGRPCPTRSAAVHEHPVSVALRLVRRAGWETGVETTCPSCSSAAAAAVQPGPHPLSRFAGPGSAAPRAPQAA